ncbi:hypothetical protein [Pelagicoccus sp. SDUM812002]|uniref:hypothetical protein n=1 Tax=Pelagicoccus sp. SDUM812002 TaxID=3041266 RepID=UPI002812318E|nr:hypothetical protein [Pelagicoccus sp. SDUM812002]
MAAEPPALPGGLGGSPLSTPQVQVTTDSFWDEVSGFAELRGGIRLSYAPGYGDESLGEARVQLKTEREVGAALIEASVDFLADGTTSEHSFDWESGRGPVDMRALSLSFSPLRDVDVKLGRQVATWGVGDLVFINDLFAKDWNSFLLGRDLEYLKAPQDSVRLAYFNDIADLEVIYSPRFESDRFIDGDRLTFWDSMSGRITAKAQPIEVASPGDAFEANELHLRASRLQGRYELAAYGYLGYWKSPAGFDQSLGLSTFPSLNVFGGSARGPLGRGIVSAEFGSYDSKSDPTGTEVMTRNSELRLLLGYEQEIGKELTASVQYYVERTRDVGAAGGLGDRDRELFTLRLRKQLWQQTLTLNGFAFHSPSQKDNYFRLSASWKASDAWQWDVGANLFGGDEPTFFGQFQNSSSAHLSLRRIF